MLKYSILRFTSRQTMSPTLKSSKSCERCFYLFHCRLHFRWCWWLLIMSAFVLFRLAEKELQRKSLEDSLNAERSSGASRETNMQVWLGEASLHVQTQSQTVLLCCFSSSVDILSTIVTLQPFMQLSLADSEVFLMLFFLCTEFDFKLYLIIIFSWTFSTCVFLQALHKDNMSLKAEIQKLQAQISEQVGFCTWTVLTHLVFQMYGSPVSL